MYLAVYFSSQKGGKVFVFNRETKINYTILFLLLKYVRKLLEVSKYLVGDKIRQPYILTFIINKNLSSVYHLFVITILHYFGTVFHMFHDSMVSSISMD